MCIVGATVDKIGQPYSAADPGVRKMKENYSNFLPQELNLDPLLTIMELVTFTKSHILKAHRLIKTILTKGPIDRVSFHKEYICYKFEMKAPTSMKFDTKN